ncbi:MAG: helix-turn-helix transcriptional regulator [Thiolinea sp.]
MKAKQSKSADRLELVPFPREGKVRVKQAAPHLAIGISTFWLFVKQGRIKQPTRYGKRVSVWDAQYIRELAENGIPEMMEAE